MSFEAQWKRVKERGIDVLTRYLVDGESPYPPIIDSQGRSKTILFSNEEYAELYTLVYAMTTKDNKAYVMYEYYEDTVKRFFADCIGKALVDGRAQCETPAAYLDLVASCLDKQAVLVKWLHHIFYYLDRYYVTLTGADHLLRCAAKIWINDHVCGVAEHIAVQIVAEVQRDREHALGEATHGERMTDGEAADAAVEHIPVVNTATLRTITAALVNYESYNPAPLTIYREKLSQATAEFYANLAAVKVRLLGCHDYIHLVKRLINDEYARMDWLKGDVGFEIQALITEHCIQAHAAELLNKADGVKHMLDTENTVDLTVCYELLSRCSAAPPTTAETSAATAPVDTGVRHTHLNYEPEAAPVAAPEQPGNQKTMAVMAELFEAFLKERGMALLKAKLAHLQNPAMRAKQITAATTDAVPNSLMNPDICDYSFIKSLIDLNVKYTTLLKSCFADDFQFKVRLKDAFEYVMNTNVGGVHMACYICTACDKLIRRPRGNLANDLPSTQNGVVEACNNIVTLFTYLNDKDLFAEIYKNQLAKRLLGAEEPPNETERLLIATFKHVCGHSYSNKIEGMLLDTTRSLGKRVEFKDYIEKLLTEIVTAKAKGEYEERAADEKDPMHVMSIEELTTLSNTEHLSFTVQELTTSHWPNFPNVELRIPPLVAKAQQLFECWYTSKNSHRRLTWNFWVTQAIVQGRFDKTYLIVCNAAQACLLLEFNDEKEHTLEELTGALGLTPVMAKKLVKSLQQKNAIVEQVERPGEAEPAYAVNAKFTSQMRRFKLPVPVENDTMQAKPVVEEDRSMTIQACLIRIMKARKQFPHQALVSECLSQLSLFRPSIKSIKENIEKVIEKDYIVRSEEDPQVYVYI